MEEILNALNLNLQYTKSASKSSQSTFEGFSAANAVWINKPQVVNRRLCGSKITHKIVPRAAEQDALLQQIKNSILQSENNLSCMHAIVDDLVLDTDVIFIRQLLPKQLDKYQITKEIVLWNAAAKVITFIPVCKSPETEAIIVIPTEFSYRLQYISEADNRCRIELSISERSTHEEGGYSNISPDWLQKHLLRKIAQWSLEPILRTGISSLHLVPLDKYNQRYQDLKQKYGYHLVKIWPETTDPQKFVFEDVAIATYLLLLWEEERQTSGSTEKQSFVDLGCGNGLLVYILSAEGHRGLGVDVRKRGIWDMFGAETELREMPVTPSDSCLYPDYDWLIGNHSDELTPWIPVIAARSAYTTRYFVLPCCPHDFNKKFSGKSSGSSQYRTYLDYVQRVGVECGFNVEEDSLRIPSTKKVCFIGRSRNYSEEKWIDIDQHITEFIKSRCVQNIDNKSKIQGIRCNSPNTQTVSDNDAHSDNSICDENNWTENFQARSNVEKSRNCLTLHKEVKEKFVQTVFDKVINADDAEKLVLPSGRVWNKGGRVSLLDAANLFDKETLQELKHECGGLQTLLRNHSAIFQVFGGNIELRDPFVKRTNKKRKIQDNSDNLKTSLCWFHDHHPDGCPRSAADCTHAHGQGELRPRTHRKKIHPTGS